MSRRLRILQSLTTSMVMIVSSSVILACAPRPNRDSLNTENPLVPPVRVDQGTESGGGGEPVYPTEAEVLEILTSQKKQYQDVPPFSSVPLFAKARLILILYRDARVYLVEKPVSANLNKILASAEELGLNPSVGLFDDAKVPLLKVNRAEPCLHNGEPKTMSVSEFKTGSEICVSVPMLMKIPRARLLTEAATLLIHESAHQLGLDEVEATQVQRYLVQDLDWLIHGRQGLRLLKKDLNQDIGKFYDILGWVANLSRKSEITSEERVQLSFKVARLAETANRIWLRTADLNLEAYYTNGVALWLKPKTPCEERPIPNYKRFCGEAPFLALEEAFLKLEPSLSTLTPEDLRTLLPRVNTQLWEIQEFLGPYFDKNEQN